MPSAPPEMGTRSSTSPRESSSSESAARRESRGPRPARHPRVAQAKLPDDDPGVRRVAAVCVRAGDLRRQAAPLDPVSDVGRKIRAQDRQLVVPHDPLPLQAQRAAKRRGPSLGLQRRLFAETTAQPQRHAVGVVAALAQLDGQIVERLAEGRADAGVGEFHPALGQLEPPDREPPAVGRRRRGRRGRGRLRPGRGPELLEVQSAVAGARDAERGARQAGPGDLGLEAGASRSRATSRVTWRLTRVGVRAEGSASARPRAPTVPPVTSSRGPAASRGASTTSSAPSSAPWASVAPRSAGSTYGRSGREREAARAHADPRGQRLPLDRAVEADLPALDARLGLEPPGRARGPKPTSWRPTPTSRSAVVTTGLVVRSANSSTPPSRRARPTTTETGRARGLPGLGGRGRRGRRRGGVERQEGREVQAGRLAHQPDVGLPHEEVPEPDAVVPEVGLDVPADEAREADQRRVVVRRQEADGPGLHARGQPVLEDLVAPVGEPVADLAVHAAAPQVDPGAQRQVALQQPGLDPVHPRDQLHSVRPGERRGRCRSR